MAKMSTPSRTREILRKCGLAPKKRLGQNFLVDPRTAEKIADTACDPGDRMIEIGPGVGALTQFLLSRAEAVIAVEIDPALVDILKKEFVGEGRLTVIQGDVLRQDLDDLAFRFFQEADAGYKVAGNLPYYVTTPILFHLFHQARKMEAAVLMLQKEVAERIVAAPGSEAYGSLSVASQFFAVPRIVARVSRRQFFPQPEVDSVILKLEMHKEPPVDVADPELFFDVVKAAFGQRRKMLLNALGSVGHGMKKEAVQRVLKDAGVDPTWRGEVLGLPEFAAICNSMASLLESEGNVVSLQPMEEGDPD